MHNDRCQHVLRHKCLDKWCNKLLPKSEPVGVVVKFTAIEFFIVQATIVNIVTVQLRIILMSWKATEKCFFLVASTKWGKNELSGIV